MGSAAWMGRPILDPAHAADLDQRAALREFGGKQDRAAAEQGAHDEYRREHHLAGAAHHLRGMLAGHAAGDRDTARKHALHYGLHLRALGHETFGEVPPEVRRRAQAEDLGRLHSFRGHPADNFISEHLGKAEKVEKAQIIPAPTPPGGAPKHAVGAAVVVRGDRGDQFGRLDVGRVLSVEHRDGSRGPSRPGHHYMVRWEKPYEGLSYTGTHHEGELAPAPTPAAKSEGNMAASKHGFRAMSPYRSEYCTVCGESYGHQNHWTGASAGGGVPLSQQPTTLDHRGAPNPMYTQTKKSEIAMGTPEQRLRKFWDDKRAADGSAELARRAVAAIGKRIAGRLAKGLGGDANPSLNAVGATPASVSATPPPMMMAEAGDPLCKLCKGKHGGDACPTEKAEKKPNDKRAMWDQSNPHFGGQGPHRYDPGDDSCKYCDRPRDYVPPKSTKKSEGADRAAALRKFWDEKDYEPGFRYRE